MDQNLDFGIDIRDSFPILRFLDIFCKNEEMALEYQEYKPQWVGESSFLSQNENVGDHSRIQNSTENSLLPSYNVSSFNGPQYSLSAGNLSNNGLMVNGVTSNGLSNIFAYEGPTQNLPLYNIASTTNKMDSRDESCDLNLQDLYDLIINDENSLRREISKTVSKENDETEKMNEPENIKFGIKCNSCELVIKNRREFISHHKDCSNKNLEYTCSSCDKTFKNYLSFRSHCFRHTPNKYKCAYCDKGFSMRSKMADHIAAIHSNDRPYACNICGMRYATQSSLSGHQRKHQRPSNMCHTCGKILLSHQGLTRHIRLHKVGKCFMCEVCGKQFRYKSHMAYHLSNTHSKVRPFACETCGKTFAESLHLKRHRKMHQKERPFKCDKCSKSFKTRSCLLTHSHIHRNEKPLVCNYCGKGFVKLNKLKEHCNIHTGDRPFVCKFCNRSFTNHPNMLKHMKRMHNKNDVEKRVEVDIDERSMTPLPSHIFYSANLLSSQSDFSSLEQEMDDFNDMTFESEMLEI